MRETTNLCVEIMNSNQETWSRVTNSRLPFDVNVKLNLFNNCFPRDDPRGQSLNVYYCRTSSSRGDQVFRLLTLETLMLNTCYTLLVQKLLVCNADQSDVNKSWRIIPKIFFLRLWMLTIYTNHPGGNLVYENKTIKFDVVGERPAKRYIQIRE